MRAPASILLVVSGLVLACSNGDQVRQRVLCVGGRRGEADIDRCIAPIVKALNDAGIETYSSCCGHGRIGHIILKDRIIFVTPATNWAEVQRIYSTRLERGDMANDAKTRKALGLEP